MDILKPFESLFLEGTGNLTSAENISSVENTLISQLMKGGHLFTENDIKVVDEHLGGFPYLFGKYELETKTDIFDRISDDIELRNIEISGEIYELLSEMMDVSLEYKVALNDYRGLKTDIADEIEAMERAKEEPVCDSLTSDEKGRSITRREISISNAEFDLIRIAFIVMEKAKRLKNIMAQLQNLIAIKDQK